MPKVALTHSSLRRRPHLRQKQPGPLDRLRLGPTVGEVASEVHPAALFVRGVAGLVAEVYQGLDPFLQVRGCLLLRSEGLRHLDAAVRILGRPV